MQNTRWELIRLCKSRIALTWLIACRSTIQKRATVWTLDEHSSQSFCAPRHGNLARALRACVRKTWCEAPLSLGNALIVYHKNIRRQLLSEGNTQKLQLRRSFAGVEGETVQVTQRSH
jgi:hypothetical protein